MTPKIVSGASYTAGPTPGPLPRLAIPAQQEPAQLSNKQTNWSQSFSGRISTQFCFAPGITPPPVPLCQAVQGISPDNTPSTIPPPPRYHPTPGATPQPVSRSVQDENGKPNTDKELQHFQCKGILTPAKEFLGKQCSIPDMRTAFIAVRWQTVLPSRKVFSRRRGRVISNRLACAHPCRYQIVPLESGRKLEPVEVLRLRVGLG